MADGGDLLRRARRSRGLTQGQLADLAGTSQEQISRWESGKRSPTADQLGELLHVLGFELSIERIEEPSQDTVEPATSQNDEIRRALRRGSRPQVGDEPSWG